MFKKTILDATGEEMHINVSVRAESNGYITYVIGGICFDVVNRAKAIMALKKAVATLPMSKLNWR
jgi:hypothetical protein